MAGTGADYTAVLPGHASPRRSCVHPGTALPAGQPFLDIGFQPADRIGAQADRFREFLLPNEFVKGGSRQTDAAFDFWPTQNAAAGIGARHNSSRVGCARPVRAPGGIFRCASVMVETE